LSLGKKEDVQKYLSYLFGNNPNKFTVRALLEQKEEKKVSKMI